MYSLISLLTLSTLVQTLLPRWAKLAAGVFLRENIPVYLFTTTTPTPFVPFTIVKVKLNALLS